MAVQNIVSRIDVAVENICVLVLPITITTVTVPTGIRKCYSAYILPVMHMKVLHIENYFFVVFRDIRSFRLPTHRRHAHLIFFFGGLSILTLELNSWPYVHYCDRYTPKG